MTGRLWRDVTAELAADHPDITLDHQLIDSFALRMLQRPTRWTWWSPRTSSAIS